MEEYSLMDCLPAACLDTLRTMYGITPTLVSQLRYCSKDQFSNYVKLTKETLDKLLDFLTPYTKANLILRKYFNVLSSNLFATSTDFAQHIVTVLSTKIPYNVAMKGKRQNLSIASQRPQQNANARNITWDKTSLPPPHFTRRLHPLYHVVDIIAVSKPNAVVNIFCPNPFFIRSIDKDGKDTTKPLTIDNVTCFFENDESGTILPIKLKEGNRVVVTEDSVIVFSAILVSTEEMVERMMREAREEKRVVQSNEQMTDEFVTREVISLKCLVGLCMLKNPVRSRYCKHEYCVEASSLVERMKLGYWSCFCKAKCAWKDVVVDTFIQGIVEKAPEDATFAEVEGKKVIRYLDEDKKEIGDRKITKMIEVIDVEEIVSSENQEKQNSSDTEVEIVGTKVKKENIEIEKINSSETNEIDEQWNEKREEIEKNAKYEEWWKESEFVDVNLEEIELESKTNDDKPKMDICDEQEYLNVWNDNIPNEVQEDIWKRRGQTCEDIFVIKKTCLNMVGNNCLVTPLFKNSDDKKEDVEEDFFEVVDYDEMYDD
ncbi:hypothetical protein EIN_084920 [Entamoeba invadens IP1]|uniref:hypothetical protein n=1 Tax=Entamoeba invadens IP1 TaxID=370355 RepID=UPI0002C3E4AC|nr:hypothetical protein EIN_084920 [Entamoeba invadens IP1]ELP85280.1 hypothetical protein EIN_084920 [Entamoeba invadens IP1]|eukprot:XP_004184626.1 hypothetical protein EIN_084920 [Entamoeba invadens IP1]